jgi:hypothetical protein
MSEDLTVEHSRKKRKYYIRKADTFAFEFLDVYQSIGCEGIPRVRKEAPVVVITRVPENDLHIFGKGVIHMLRNVQVDEITKMVVHVVATIEFDEDRWFGDG